MSFRIAGVASTEPDEDQGERRRQNRETFEPSCMRRKDTKGIDLHGVEAGATRHGDRSRHLKCGDNTPTDLVEASGERWKQTRRIVPAPQNAVEEDHPNLSRVLESFRHPLVHRDFGPEKRRKMTTGICHGTLRTQGPARTDRNPATKSLTARRTNLRKPRECPGMRSVRYVTGPCVPKTRRSHLIRDSEASALPPAPNRGSVRGRWVRGAHGSAGGPGRAAQGAFLTILTPKNEYQSLASL